MKSNLNRIIFHGETKLHFGYIWFRASCKHESSSLARLFDKYWNVRFHMLQEFWENKAKVCVPVEKVAEKNNLSVIPL